MLPLSTFGVDNVNISHSEYDKLLASKRYHHGNLEAALLESALETIRIEGVDAVTLRGVGAKVGVSRTALYRHFSDKAALMARVASEGFRLLRATLQDTWNDALKNPEANPDPISTLGHAYVRFALANQGYYRTMFGRIAADWCTYPELMIDGGQAFQILLDAVVLSQTAGRVVPGDPLGIARVLWASVHGVAMLTMDGHLTLEDHVVELATRSLREGIGIR